MKRLLVVLIIAVMGIDSALASNNVFIENDKKASITLVKTDVDQQTTLVLEYDTFEDLESFAENVLADMIKSEFEDCSVTATVTVSHTYNATGDIQVISTGHSTTVSLSATVTASCSEIGGVIKKLIADLKKQLGI